MLYQKRVELVLQALHASNSEIARCCGCAPSTISRLKTGARPMREDSPTVKKFVTGVYHYAVEKSLTGELQLLTGINAAYLPEKKYQERLRTWLFDRDAVVSPREQADKGMHTAGSHESGRRLRRLISLAGVSYSALSRQLNIDPSYLSKLCTGERTLRPGVALLMEMSEALYASICAHDETKSLAALLYIPEQTLAQEGAIAVRDWLAGVSKTQDLSVVRAMLKHIGLFTLQDIPMQDPATLYETLSKTPFDPARAEYIGGEGLLTLCAHFFADAIRHHAQELWLYSDQSTEWIYGKFAAGWINIGQAVAAHNIRLRVIHTIDAGIEDIAHLSSLWLPLWLSGHAQSDYYGCDFDRKFSHTLFLNPDRAAIDAVGVRAMDHRLVYRYETEEKGVAYCRETFEALAKDSRPLVRTLQEEEAARRLLGTEPDLRFADTQIYLSEEGAAVLRMKKPRVALIFTHPAVAKAFRRFTETPVFPTS